MNACMFVKSHGKFQKVFYEIEKTSSVAETLITAPYGQRSSTVLPTPLNSRHRSVNNKKKQSKFLGTTRTDYKDLASDN